MHMHEPAYKYRTLNQQKELSPQSPVACLPVQNADQPQGATISVCG